MIEVILEHPVFYGSQYYKAGQKITVESAQAQEMAKHGKVIERETNALETQEKPATVKRGRRSKKSI